MAIARIGEQLDHGDPDAVGDAYERALRDLVSMVTEPDRFRERWAEEDEALSASEAATNAAKTAGSGSAASIAQYTGGAMTQITTQGSSPGLRQR